MSSPGTEKPMFPYHAAVGIRFARRNGRVVSECEFRYNSPPLTKLSFPRCFPMKLKMLSLRLPPDWHSRISSVAPAGMGKADYVRHLIRPVLAGEVVPVFNENGLVVGFNPGCEESLREISDPPQQGRPEKEPAEA